MTDFKTVKNGKTASRTDRPAKFTYALIPWIAVRRQSGWYIAENVPSVIGNKPEWRGPFETVADAVRIIGSVMASEISQRHLRMIAAHAIARTDRLHGLETKHGRRPCKGTA